jgi:CheY-like chemotaxis protein
VRGPGEARSARARSVKRAARPVDALRALSPAELQSAVVRDLWDRLPEFIGQVVGMEVELGEPQPKQDWPTVKGTYIARLRFEMPQGLHLHIGLDVKSAIACSGLLVMMQEKIIREKIDRTEFTDDDADAVAECINQFSATFNDVFREHIGTGTRVVFDEGVVGKGSAKWAEMPGGFVRLHAKFKIGMSKPHEGRFDVILPLPLFEPALAEEGQAASDGLTLSAEELAALRAAAAENFGSDKLVVLMGVDRDREAWDGVLKQLSIDYEFAWDVHHVRRLCRDREAGMVIVDADACAAGGLPALARLRGNSPAVPLLVAASRPTRTHLVSCMAAGAATYMLKPIDPTRLLSQVEAVRAAWRG